MQSQLNQPMSQPAAPPTGGLDSARLRPAGLLLAAGGLLFVLMYAIEIVFGLRHGRLYDSGDPASSALARGGFIAFSLALFTVGAGLLQLGRAMRARAAIPAIVGMLLAAVAFVLMPLNLAYLGGAFGAPRHIPGLTHPILTNLAATILLSVTALRLRLLPAPVGRALLAAGLVTFPFILLTIPLEALMPEYLIADLPFAAWGATLLAVGWLIARQPRA